MNIVEQLVGLIRKTSSELPADVVKALKAAARREKAGSGAQVVLKTILDNVALAKRQGTPLCQDTGTLTFFVDEALKKKVTTAAIRKAVAIATERGYLRKNCIDAVTGKSYDDNCAVGAPVIHYVEGKSKSEKGKSVEGKKGGGVTLLMKGGGSENMSRQYSLPDPELGGRDLEGVRACVLDAVKRAQGFGCAPGILGVCIGGDRATGFAAAKEQLLRGLGDESPSSLQLDSLLQPPSSLQLDNSLQPAGTLRKLEKRLLKEANELGIGPMGLGGKTTLLGVKVCARPRVPASFFVTVAYMCWATRRQRIVISDK